MNSLEQHTDTSVDKAMHVFAITCKNKGLKLTHQRSETFRILLLQPDHPTAELIHKRLQTTLPTLSLDTVYRTLSSLEECNLVRRIHTPESQARFEAECGQHHHFICNNCKRVIDFEWQDMDNLELPDAALSCGTIDTKTVVVYGRCVDCR